MARPRPCQPAVVGAAGRVQPPGRPAAIGTSARGRAGRALARSGVELAVRNRQRGRGCLPGNKTAANTRWPGTPHHLTLSPAARSRPSLVDLSSRTGAGTGAARHRALLSAPHCRPVSLSALWRSSPPRILALSLMLTRPNPGRRRDTAVWLLFCRHAVRGTLMTGLCGSSQFPPACGVACLGSSAPA